MSKFSTGFALAATVMLLTGCGSKEKHKKDVKTSCTMSVYSHYSGWGEDGHFLGEGNSSESFIITAGDVFYETYDGHWTKEQRKGEYPYDVIAEIKSVGTEIRWTYNGNEYSTRYDRSSEVNSMYTVFDGINYDYKVTFSDYNEE